MLPRGKIDIGWADLAWGIGRCLWPGSRARAQRRIEAFWAPQGDALACLSVRSGFDALLTALAFPPGDEILFSALTIRDMTRIVEEHGLVAVPVDLDMATLSLEPAALERAAGPRTRAIVVAHVFGSRMPLDGVIAFAHERGLLVIEDCAQSYVGNEYTGHPDSDVSMFSFGPIKTYTALGGALLRVRDRALLERTRAIQARHPIQSRGRFGRRLVRYAMIKGLAAPRAFGVFAAVCRAFGRTHDEVISAAVRGFSGPAFFVKIRQQPSYPLLALLERRLLTFDPARIERRAATAEAAIRLLPGVERPGAKARQHTHWVFPIESATPDELMHHLWRAGFDATRGASSLHVVEPPADRSELAATKANQAMERLLYLPVYPDVSTGDLARLARAVAAFRPAGEALSPGRTGDRAAEVRVERAERA